MKFISDRLRETLMDAVVTSRENTLLAGRFDAALNNMPLGLCMFDGERRLVVINQRCSELLGVSVEEAHQGASARKLMQSAACVGTLTRESAERLAEEIESGPSGRGTRTSKSKSATDGPSHLCSNRWRTAAPWC